MEVKEWVGNICIQSSCGDIFSLSSTKYQTHKEVIGNFYFHTFQFLSLGDTVCHLGTSSLSDQSFPSAVWVREVSKTWTPPGETVGVGCLNPTLAGFLSDKLFLFYREHPHAPSTQNFSQEGTWTLLFTLKFRWQKEGCKLSERKILVTLPVDSSGSSQEKRGVWRAWESPCHGVSLNEGRSACLPKPPMQKPGLVWCGECFGALTLFKKEVGW